MADEKIMPRPLSDDGARWERFDFHEESYWMRRVNAGEVGQDA